MQRGSRTNREISGMDVGLQPCNNKQHGKRVLCARLLPSHRGFAPGVRPGPFIVCSIVSLAKAEVSGKRTYIGRSFVDTGGKQEEDFQTRVVKRHEALQRKVLNVNANKTEN